MKEERKSACKLLGVSDGASQAEIQAAYERLMQRFSETNYLGSPLWDMAEEKRVSIRAAYALLTQTEPASEPDRPAPAEVPEAAAQGSVNYRVRNMLNMNDLDGAENLLAEQPDRETNPEWIFLRGMLAWKRGWLDEATGLVKQAAAMEPNNAEYKASLNRIRNGPSRAKDKETWKEVCCTCGAECICEAICEGLCEGI